MHTDTIARQIERPCTFDQFLAALGHRSTVSMDVTGNTRPKLPPGSLVIDRLQKLSEMAVVLPEEVDGQRDHDRLLSRLLEDQTHKAVPVVILEGAGLEGVSAIGCDDSLVHDVAPLNNGGNLVPATGGGSNGEVQA